MRAFTCSSQVVFCIFVVSKLWIMLVVVQPSLPGCGKCGCLCNKHNSCWSPAYPGWQSSSWAQGSWWCCPSSPLATGSSEHVLWKAGWNYPSAQIMALVWGNTAEGWNHHCGTLLWPAGCVGLLGLLWDAAVFAPLSALPISLPFLYYPFSPGMAKSKFYLCSLRSVWFFVGTHLNNISIRLTRKICSM